ncbi:hypothetical protein [Nocardioides taihuensis]|uniref:Glycine rich protein n=1 Tax=Nocardioides taihuensis TaxID=1835606 RepID=A0ABW0BLK2_9ACTN
MTTPAGSRVPLRDRATGGEALEPRDRPTLGRRAMFVLGGTAAAGVAGVVAAAPADAASATTAWKCGGNTGITTDGTNYLGPRNTAPLIFKTTPSGGTPTERLRVAPTGLVGIGTNAPAVVLDVRGSTASVVQGTNTGTTSTSTGVSGVSSAGSGVTGQSTSGSGVAGTTQGGIGVAGTSTNNIGVQGSGAYSGVVGSGGSYGGIFSGTSYGVYGYGPTGVYASGSTYGLYANGPSYGVYAYSGSGRGIQAQGVIGVHGISSDTNSSAVQGEGGQYGVRGFGARTAGVRGDSSYVGVWGQGPSYGVYGYADGSGGYAVMGQVGGSASWGLYSIGNAAVQGTLYKSAGSFRIDHPLDPEHKYLSHSFVESPDMMNVYNGVVVLDGSGEAEVTLPDYFGVLNRDYRYQLTAIGAPGPRLHVKSEIEDNRFVIAGGKPGAKVSWQVTGIRQDDYAREHPIVVEESKPADQRGTRLFVPQGSKARQFTPRAAAAKEAGAAAPSAEEQPDPLARLRRD